VADELQRTVGTVAGLRGPHTARAADENGQRTLLKTGRAHEGAPL
jgi:hypothetical protein